MNSLTYDDVPRYCEKFSLGKQHDYCVVIFVINEGEKLHQQLARIQKENLSNVDIIVSDGGSIDGSTNREILKPLGVNTLLVKEDIGKLGSQMRIAFSWVLEHDYKGVVVIDGNNKDSVENIRDFIEKLEQGYDHIQGSRFIPGGRAINTPISRLLGLKLLHIPMMRLASGFKYTDTTNGFRAYSSSLLASDKIALFRSLFTGYELHYYLAIESHQQGFKCIEIPVTRTYPKGKIPTQISPVHGNLTIMITLIKVCCGCYSLGKGRHKKSHHP